MLGEIVAETLHGGFVGSMKVHIGNLVETDEVDAAVESFEQSDEFAGMRGGVVNTAKHDVFERAPQASMPCATMLLSTTPTFRGQPAVRMI